MKLIKKIYLRLLRYSIWLICVPILMLRANQSYKNAVVIARYIRSAAFYYKNYKMGYQAIRLLLFKIPWTDYVPDRTVFDEKMFSVTRNDDRIGMWQGIKDSPIAPSEILPDNEHFQLLSIGREAFAQILAGEIFTKKTVLIPIFTCLTVIDPFFQDGWEIIPYSIQRDLTIDCENLAELFRKYEPSVCVLQEYSGMSLCSKEEKLVEYMHQKGCRIILDQTQNIYGKKDNDFIDYYCGSLRKWYPMQDGGFLLGKNYKLAPVPSEENTIYRTSMGLSMFAGYLSSVYACNFFEFLCGFMWKVSVGYICTERIKPHRMSEYSKKIYFSQNEEENRRRRRENYNYMYHRLSNLKTITLACNDLSRLNSIPLSVPIYVENRQKLILCLLQNRIYAMILWNKPKNFIVAIAADAEATYIYQHVISLPCDQRYGIKEMEYICDVLEKFDQDNQKTAV